MEEVNLAAHASVSILWEEAKLDLVFSEFIVHVHSLGWRRHVRSLGVYGVWVGVHRILVSR